MRGIDTRSVAGGNEHRFVSGTGFSFNLRATAKTPAARVLSEAHDDRDTYADRNS